LPTFYKPHLGMFLLDMFCALVIALVDILFPVVTRKELLRLHSQSGDAHLPEL